jgi:hypothetical protein
MEKVAGYPLVCSPVTALRFTRAMQGTPLSINSTLILSTFSLALESTSVWTRTYLSRTTGAITRQLAKTEQDVNA